MILFSFCFTNQILLLPAITVIWMVFVYFVTANVKYFEMSRRGLTCFEQHFFFSNRPIQFFMGQSSYQSSYDQLFALCAVIVFVLPLIVHQVNFFQLIFYITELFLCFYVPSNFLLFLFLIRFDFWCKLIRNIWNIILFFFTFFLRDKLFYYITFYN